MKKGEKVYEKNHVGCVMKNDYTNIITLVEKFFFHSSISYLFYWKSFSMDFTKKKTEKKYPTFYFNHRHFTNENFIYLIEFLCEGKMRDREQNFNIHANLLFLSVDISLPVENPVMMLFIISDMKLKFSFSDEL
jgi:hypothetical protein